MTNQPTPVPKDKKKSSPPPPHPPKKRSPHVNVNMRIK